MERPAIRKKIVARRFNMHTNNNEFLAKVKRSPLICIGHLRDNFSLARSERRAKRREKQAWARKKRKTRDPREINA